MPTEIFDLRVMFSPYINLIWFMQDAEHFVIGVRSLIEANPLFYVNLDSKVPIPNNRSLFVAINVAFNG